MEKALGALASLDGLGEGSRRSNKFQRCPRRLNGLVGAVTSLDGVLGVVESLDGVTE